MMRFFWKDDPDGVTHRADLGDTQAEVKQERPDLYEWRIIWEGLTLIRDYAPSIQEAMGRVANWHSARHGSVVGEALTVLMDEVKRLKAQHKQDVSAVALGILAAIRGDEEEEEEDSE